jgi:hypothetical protein
MSIPLASDFFGINTQILIATTSIVASPSAPILIIKQSDFAAQSWNGLIPGDENDPEKWISAIIRKIHDFSLANTDDLPNVVITPPTLGLESRTNILKRRFSYTIDIYQPDTGSEAPDPDLV